MVGAVLGLALAVGGCSSPRRLPGDRIPGRTLTIYASAPLQGASAVGAQAVINGELMALAQRHARIGRYRIVFRALDDSTVARGGWDPGQTTLNARLARVDPTTIGYLGDFDSGASAVSIPVLNRAGIPQISATNTAVGLTSNAAGASPGEPEKYYPTGIRTYARVVPSDTVQSVAQVRLQKAQGCRSTFVLDDGDVDGTDGATSFQDAAKAAGLALAGVQGYDPRAADYSALAAAVAQTGADCVLISADPENHAVLLTTQLAAALPRAMLFGTAGLAEASFVDPAQHGIPLSLDSRMLITVAALGAAQYPRTGREFLAAYAARYGAAEPDAIFGYEAMSLLLDAISRATDRGRRAAERSKVRAAILSTHRRRGAVGEYSIDRHGDPTLRRYGVWRVIGGELVFWQALAG